MVGFGFQSRTHSDTALAPEPRSHLSRSSHSMELDKGHKSSSKPKSVVVVKAKNISTTEPPASAETKQLPENGVKRKSQDLLSQPPDLGPNQTPIMLTRTFVKVIISLENCILPNERLYPTPSILEGMDPRTEWFLRRLGCDIIQHAGILLKLPQTAMATAQVLYQRFYYAKSFIRNHYLKMGMACVYLSSKVEEAPKRLRDIVNVFTHVRQVLCSEEIKPVILDYYVGLKNQLIKSERSLLKELGFCVHVKHPHKLIVMYLQVLEQERNTEFVQKAWWRVEMPMPWVDETPLASRRLITGGFPSAPFTIGIRNLMNDSLRTDLFVRFSPEAIACGCIFLAARELQIPLPRKPAWYQLFNVPAEDISDIATNMLLLYSIKLPPVAEIEAKLETLRLAFEKSREKGPLGTVVADNIKTPDSVVNTSPEQLPERKRTSSKSKKKSPNDRRSRERSAERRDSRRYRNSGSAAGGRNFQRSRNRSKEGSRQKNRSEERSMVKRDVSPPRSKKESSPPKSKKEPRYDTHRPQSRSPERRRSRSPLERRVRGHVDRRQ